jgi:hypothetical protein
MTKPRIAVIFGAVVLVVGVVAGRERPALELIEESAAERAMGRATAQADDGIDLERLQRGELGAPQKDPFARKEFAPVQARQVAQEKPTAPPLPFQYFGRITENGKTEVFVTRGDEVLSIAPGQKLGEYRVDQVGAAAIAFTYLPLKTKQTLDIQ